MTTDSPVISAAYSEPLPQRLLSHRSNGLALIEGVSLLGCLALLDHFGGSPFASWPVHPFLFVVVLLSAQYGLQGGLLAASGAVALSFMSDWPVRPFDMAYAEYFRIAWAEPLCWIFAALTVGVITSHRSKLLEEQAEMLRKASQAESLIAQQYEVLARRTRKLERRAAGGS